MSFALSPEQARAQYLAVFSLGEAGQEVVGPSLTTTLALTVGLPGWIGLGALFTVFGLSSRVMARWVQARQPAVDPRDRQAATRSPS